jgi:hypothetical protein
MNDKRNDGIIWDRLFTLLYPCDERLSDEELEAELKSAGIDMEPGYRRLSAMVETHRARAKLAGAGNVRATLRDKIHNVVAPRIEDLRNGVRSLIGKLKGDQAQLAYFHKLEGAATEEDLQSLLDDLEKLAAMQELRNDESK